MRNTSSKRHHALLSDCHGGRRGQTGCNPRNDAKQKTKTNNPARTQTKSLPLVAWCTSLPFRDLYCFAPVVVFICRFFFCSIFFFCICLPVLHVFYLFCLLFWFCTISTFATFCSHERRQQLPSQAMLVHPPDEAPDKQLFTQRC